MSFIPEQPKQQIQVPFFDDVTRDQGWQGHTTSKNIEVLKSEIMVAISRLGGLVTGFQAGTFLVSEQKRDGFRINYVIERSDSLMARGRVDIAALPVRDRRLKRSYETRRTKSLKMALYMLRMALEGTWFLQQLSPGYAPLLPWMLEEHSGKTITQLWSESVTMAHLLPSGNSEFEEAEFEEV